MENQLTIREAVTKNDTALFWEQLYSYYKRDMFPNPEDEDRAYFLGTEYRETMEKIHDRKENRCYYILFYHEKQNVGFICNGVDEWGRENDLKDIKITDVFMIK